MRQRGILPSLPMALVFFFGMVVLMTVMLVSLNSLDLSARIKYKAKPKEWGSRGQFCTKPSPVV